MKNKLGTIWLICLLTLSSHTTATFNIPDQLGIKFVPNELTMPEKLTLINHKLTELNPALSKPLSINYIDYYGEQFDIIISFNQPIEMNTAVVGLVNEPYIKFVKIVGAIIID